MKLRERLAFWEQFRRDLAVTGAVQPSSRFLAREMTAPLRRDPSARRRIVEMGPGTGAVTRAIAGAMGPGDELDCYEINPRFADYLREAVASHPAYERACARIRVHCAPAESAQAEQPVDFVICSVPLNNLPPEAVRRILAAGMAMLREGGWLTYFEYPGLPRLRRLLANAEERRRIDEVRGIKAELRTNGSRSRLVPCNLPPARAVHVRRDATPRDATHGASVTGHLS